MVPEPPANENQATDVGGGRPAVAPVHVPDHELLHRIGEGSYGEVWLARSVLGQYRAVKVVYRARLHSERPFEREFSGIQRFEPVSRSHEGFVDILQVGRDDKEGYFYYVMELADNGSAEERAAEPSHPGPRSISPESYTPKTLASELRRRGRFQAEECLRLGISLASALGRLHEHGLVHRDVKPSNIIFVQGVPKLADIGLVTTLNETHSFVGTEGFIPPEGPGSTSADLYSLGKVLYEISTGRDRQDFPQLPEDFLNFPEGERREVAEFNEVLLRACHRDPLQRYRNAAEMQADLAVLLSGKSLQQIRRIERRLTQATRLGIIIGVLALIAWVGYLFQQGQSRKFKQMAEENQRLAEESRARLARLQVANGQRLLEAGDLLGALPWYADALTLEKSQPGKLREHQLRLAATIGQSPRLLQIWRHEAAVNCAEFSPDGRRVVAAGRDGVVRVWDARSGEAALVPLTGSGEVRRAAFSPDGGLVIAIGSQGTHIWNGRTGDLVQRFPQPDLLGTMAISADGQWLAVGNYYGKIAVRNLATGTELSGPWKLQSEIFCLAFHPAEFRLFAGSWDGSGVVWDLETASEVFGFKADGGINAAEFSPDGLRLVTAHYRNQGCVWDAETGLLLVPSLTHEQGLSTARFDPAGARVITASSDYTAAIWDLHQGHRLRELRHEHPVLDARFGPDGTQILTRDMGGVVQLWSATTGKLLASPFRHGHALQSASLDAEGSRLLIACEDGTVRLWDLWVEEGSWTPTRETIRALDSSGPGSRLLTEEPGGKLRIWDTVSWRPIAATVACTNRVIGSVVFPDDGRLWVWSMAAEGEEEGRWLEQFVADTGELVSRVECGAGMVGFCVDPKSDGVLLAETGAVVGWNAREGEKVWGPVRFKGRCQMAQAIADRGRALVIEGKRVHVIDMRTGEAPGWVLEHPHLVSYGGFSPDGRYLATACGDWGTTERQARVWEASSGRMLNSLPHSQAVWGMAFDRESRRVATASSDQTARVWDVATGRPLSPPLRHPTQAFRVAFSPDGQWVAVGTSDEKVWLWNWQTGELLGPPFQHPSPVEGIKFLGDGRTLLVKGAAGHTGVWRLPEVGGAPEGWSTLAEILSGHQCDATGAPAPLEAAQLIKEFNDLRQKQPELFQPLKRGR